MPVAGCRRLPRDVLQGGAGCSLPAGDRDSPCGLCILQAPVPVTLLPLARPQGRVRSSAHLSFLLAFDKEALIHNSTEARNVLISHGFPFRGLILEVFSRVVQNFHLGSVHQSSGQHASVVP